MNGCGKTFNRRCALALAATLCVTSALHSTPGRSEVPKRQQHAWGRFQIGAWKHVRVVTQTLNAAGEVDQTRTTDTKSTLLSVDDSSCELQFEVTVELAGKQFVSPAKRVQLGFLGEGRGEQVEVEELPGESLEFDGRRVDCRSQRITIHGENLETVSHVLSIAAEPYVLRRSTQCRSTDGGKLAYAREVWVLAGGLPFRVCGEIKPSHLIKTRHQAADTTTLTLEIHCPEVPGAVVWHSSQVRDRSGRTLERSVLELVDFGLTSRRPSGHRDDEPVARRGDDWRH